MMEGVLKAMVEGSSHHLKVDNWVTKNPWKIVDTDTDTDQRKLDKKCLEEMVWRLVEEIFNPTILEEVKQKLSVGIGNVIHRDEETMVASHACRKEDEGSRTEGKDELIGVFLKENLILSMLHKDQGVFDSLIGGFESSLVLDNSI